MSPSFGSDSGLDNTNSLMVHRCSYLLKMDAYLLARVLGKDLRGWCLGAMTLRVNFQLRHPHEEFSNMKLIPHELRKISGLGSELDTTAPDSRASGCLVPDRTVQLKA
jgi:hypothetical protein